MRKVQTDSAKGNSLGTLGCTLAIACLAGALFSAGCATTPKAPPPLTAEQRQLNLESFDHVWNTVRERYWDPELGGLDWPAVRDELRPRVEQATTMPEARGIMNDMVSRLGVSHFAIIPAVLYEDIEQPAGTGARDADVGIDVRVVDGRALVTSTVEGFPADEAGVQLGWESSASARRRFPRSSRRWPRSSRTRCTRT